MVRALDDDRGKFFVPVTDADLFRLRFHHIWDARLATDVALRLFLVYEMVLSKFMRWYIIGQCVFSLLFLYKGRWILVIFRLCVVKVNELYPCVVSYFLIKLVEYGLSRHQILALIFLFLWHTIVIPLFRNDQFPCFRCFLRILRRN